MRYPAAVDKALFLAAVVRLMRRNAWTRDRLARHQQNSIARLRSFALARSPFYQRFHKGLEHAPLAELPVLSKSQLMASFDELVTDRTLNLRDVRSFAGSMNVSDRLRARYQVVATSGTTGEQAFFVFDPDEWRTAIAGGARAISWAHGRPAKGERNAMMTTTLPWHMSARMAHELRRLGFGGQHQSFDSGEPLDHLVTALNACAPTSFIAYPSMMQVLAQEQAAGRLNVAPRRIQCSAEVMTAEAREAIAEAFDVAPSNIYAASECGCVAASCATSAGLHVLEDLVLIENVDERGRPLPPGEPGARALLTAFGSRTMPLIRYELNDSLVMSRGSCSCGLPFACIETVAGRTGDVLNLPKRDGGVLMVARAQISACLRGTSVSAWQVAQSPAGIVIACITPQADFAPQEIAARIEACLAAGGAVALRVTAMRVDRLERGVTGKSAFLRQAHPGETGHIERAAQ